MRLFNIDFHISVVADIRTILSDLGHQVDSLSLSNHSWVFGRPKDSVPELDGMSFDSFGQRECDRFIEGRSQHLAEYDGFLVTHSPCLSGLYEKTGKPVICVVSTRYDTFCQTPSSRAWLNDLLSRMHESGQLILLANNAYDAWHVHHHLGITPRIVPSFCGYTGARWSTPSRPPIFHGRTTMAGLSGLPRGHSWDDVASSAACVAVPYNVSLMSIFERHTMGMPIVVPSPEWTVQNSSSLSELRHSGSASPEEIEAAIRLADWYTGELPGITFFESEDDLRRILSDGARPVTGIRQRRDRILETWRMVLHDLSSHQVSSTSRQTEEIDGHDDLAGFWRWCDGFYGELRSDGTFIQHREANLEMNFGSWAPISDGFEMELTGHWKKTIKLDGLDTGTWRLFGSSDYSGSIRRLGVAPSCPTDERRQKAPSCDSYRSLADKSTIVLHTDSVIEWHRRCRPAFEYVLVTTHSDSPVDERFGEILDDERLVSWYAMNVCITHAKLKPVPIGICHRFALVNHGDPARPMGPEDYVRLLEKASCSTKTKQFNVSFSTQTNRVVREGCLRATGLPSVTLEREGYIADLGSSRYCISPEGCGIDCHRTWEALCCRTIPVITWNPMVNMGLYDGLPVIILDRWEDFNAADFTTERYERMMRDFDPAALALDRWIPTPDQKRSVPVSRETPVHFQGWYRWHERFLGEFLPQGAFIQHNLADTSDKKQGRWWYDEGKLWFELTGYWTKYALPDGDDPSPLFLLGHGEFGAISRIDSGWSQEHLSHPASAARAAIFSSIYRDNVWGGGSGNGSTAEFTSEYREFLSDYMRRNRIGSVLDVGCGDWQFSRFIDWSGIDYLGVDVVPELIRENNHRFGASGIRFDLMDFAETEPPEADLVIIKDVLQHLSFDTVGRILDKFRKFDRILITQDCDGPNSDCNDGGHRMLDLQLPPFNLSVNRLFAFTNNPKVVYEWRPGATAVGA